MRLDPQDLIGKKFSNLSVQTFIEYKNKSYFYECKCDCGNIKVVKRSDLLRNHVKSCGCRKLNALKDYYTVKDITGNKYGRLTALSLQEIKKHQTMWLCKCSCGNTVVVRSCDLKSGKTKSCGCLHSEHSRIRATRHGGCGSRLYKTWNNMRSRCNNSRNKEYKYYGGRGISYCAEWETFSEFQNWALNSGYKDNLTIERIDVNKGYYPENCTWIPKSKQNLNKRNNHNFTLNGKTQCLSEWIKECNLPSKSFVYNRLRKGIPFEKIVGQSL